MKRLYVLLTLIPVILAVHACDRSVGTGAGSEIDDLIYSIPALPEPEIHDDETLLSESQEARDGTIFACSEYEREFADASSAWPLFDTNADVIWPGACLQGASLTRATHDPLTIPRGPGEIVFTNINGQPVSTAAFPVTSVSAVTEAANEIVGTQPNLFPADFVVSIVKVRTTEELQIALQASGSFFGVFSASSSFELEEDERYSHFLVTLRQTFYDLVYERPGLPHEFFAGDVDLEDIAPHVGSGNPPTYVSRVGYGRVFYLLVESIERDTDMSSTLHANFNLGVFGADAGAQIDYVSQFRDLRIAAYAYGGDSNEALNAVFSGLGNLNAFRQSLRESAQITQAKPLFYTVRSVATDELVKNGYGVGYTYRECIPIGTPCTPAPFRPAPGATMDNGCRCTNDAVTWRFSWSGCGNSDRYEIQIVNASYGVITRTTTARSIDITLPDFVSQRTGWSWKVRAQTLGKWGSWSPTRTFSVEEVDRDCSPTGVQIYEHSVYDGRNIIFNRDVPNLHDFSFGDKLSSLKLHNIDSVILYEHKNYQGRFYEFRHNCPNVKDHNRHAFPHDMASSLRIVRCN